MRTATRKVVFGDAEVRGFMKLFNILVDEKDLHQNFVRMKNDPYKVKLLSEWADDKFIQHDGKDKFVKEFQKTFNSSFWELYCYNVFKNLGAKIDFNHSTPDFNLGFEYSRLIVECAIASNSKDNIEEWEDDLARLMPVENMEDIIYNQIIRLSNAFMGKSKKYKESYCEKSWVKDNPFVIAIAPFDQPNFMITGTTSIRTLLYGLQVNMSTFEDWEIEALAKTEKTELKMGVFTSTEFSHVSGILFSNTATMGKVTALSDDPDASFYHLRYNLKYDRPKISFDSRMQNAKNNPLAAHIRFVSQNMIDTSQKRFTIDRPLLKWNSKYKETITDGLMLFLNPFADTPVGQNIVELMKEQGVNIFSYDLEKKTDIADINDGSLIQRKVYGKQR